MSDVQDVCAHTYLCECVYRYMYMYKSLCACMCGVDEHTGQGIYHVAWRLSALGVLGQ